MKTVFNTILSSRNNLSDVGVLIDPFTGKTSTSIPVVVRHPANPIVTANSFFDSIQEQSLSSDTAQKLSPQLQTLCDTFNPGLAIYKDEFIMLVRYQNSARENGLYIARSNDGVKWTHSPTVLDLPDLPTAPDPVQRRLVEPDITEDKKWHPGAVYDPRITQMDDASYLIALAVDYDTVETDDTPYVNICDNVLYRTRDFESFEFVTTLMGATRNSVMFPRKINGFYYAAGRPNSQGRVNTTLFKSPDLINWEIDRNLFRAGHAWMNYAGPGFPPFETEDYWVLGVHGVEEHGQHRVHYRAGVCLLDKETLEVVAGPVPLLDPTEQYELDGTVDNVIFPTGILFSDGYGNGIKNPDMRCAIYYGGADRVVGAGLTTVGKLIEYTLGTYNPLR